MLMSVWCGWVWSVGGGRQISVVALASTVTEFNSNAAACNMLLPIVAELSVALRVRAPARGRGRGRRARRTGG